MTEAERARILSEDYIDIIVEYRGDKRFLEGYQDAVVHIMNEEYAILYVPAAQLGMRTLNFLYAEIPIVYGLTQDVNLDASGVSQIRRVPALNLFGDGVIIAIVDTGIDYRNPVFMNDEGSSRILTIWDQTIETGNSPMNTEFGTEYTNEEINLALQSEDPLSIVPSMDVNGHGTMMAAIAAGKSQPQENFYGVAPNADFIIVKLREAKQAIRNFFLIPDNVVCYQENHLMWGIQYCYYKARELRRPVIICIGSGTSFDSHDNRSPLCTMSDVIANTPNVVMVYPVGNEGNRGRHYFGVIDPTTRSNTVEFNVGENETGFTMAFWGNSPGLFSIDIRSPSGEYIPRIPPSITVNRVVTFIFEPTTIYVNYQTIESQSGDQLILLRFSNVSSGIWTINVYEQSQLATSFHIWMPMGDFISLDTYFIQPSINTTVLSPATSIVPISLTAYNAANNNLYVNAGRGYTRSNVVKPELAAPGVNYIAPSLDGSFQMFTGTSVATAHGVGIAALVMEWSAVKMNRPGIDTVEVKNFLILGAKRRENLTYPNRDWGYGIIDLLHSFNILRSGQ